MSAPPALHPLGVGELLDAAIYIYRKNFVTLIGIGAVMAVPIMLIQSAVSFSNTSLSQFIGGVFTPLCTCTNINLGSLALNYLMYSGMTALLGPAVIVIQVGALAFAVSRGRMGRRVRIGSAYRHALRRWLSLLISAVLVQLSVLAAFMLLFVPFFLVDRIVYVIEMPWLLATLVAVIPFSVPLIFLSVRWSLTTPAIMLEDLGVFRGMGRSWHLAGKSFWRTWAVLLTAGLVVHMLTYAVFAAVQFGASLIPSSPVISTLITSAGGLVAGAVIQPLAFVALTLLYYDLRVRHEGYDLQLALDQLKQPATAVATEAPA